MFRNIKKFVQPGDLIIKSLIENDKKFNSFWIVLSIKEDLPIEGYPYIIWDVISKTGFVTIKCICAVKDYLEHNCHYPGTISHIEYKTVVECLKTKEWVVHKSARSKI